MVIVIVVIAIIAGITTVAYRSSQSKARDSKRQSDVLVLRAAIEEYYADKGAYPRTGTCTVGDGSPHECWAGEVWNLLKNEGYLTKVPMPDRATSATQSSGKNLAPGGKAYYGYLSGADGNWYLLYAVLESGDCRTGSDLSRGWHPADFPGLTTCNF